MATYPEPKKDSWIWGDETLIWGFEPEHKYTCKILQPKVGRAGMLSLQYHNEKSESWIQVQGRSWALLVTNGTVCSRILKPGDIQNINTGVIHRVMGLTEDCKILEPSTPDAHAADKSKVKDVIRLHCVLGRDVVAARNEMEAAAVKEAIQISEEAIVEVEAGRTPREINAQVLVENGGFHIPLS